MKHEIIIQVTEQGTISDFKKREIGTVLKSFAGKRIRFVIERLKSKRSDQQNKYYWSCVIQDEIDCIRKEWGEIWSKDDMHSFNKIYFFGDEKVIEATGEIFKVPKSSITTKSDFSEAIEKIKQFFQLQFNYRIREANEDLFND